MTTLVVTGTDTDVGKTIVTAALAARARGRGQRVAVVKPVQTGVADDEPGDLDAIAHLSGAGDLHELARHPDPLAPATAALRDGRPGLSAVAIADAVRTLADGDRDLVLVEGAGGLLVRFDAAGATLADVATLLDAPVLVVARSGLGTLNHTALTCAELARRGLRCVGIVVGSWPREPGLADECNLRDLSAYAGVPVLGRIPEGAGRLDPAVFAAGARDWLTTEEWI